MLELESGLALRVPEFAQYGDAVGASHRVDAATHDLRGVLVQSVAPCPRGTGRVPPDRSVSRDDGFHGLGDGRNRAPALLPRIFTRTGDGTSNVELVEIKLQPGSYEMEVQLTSDGDNPAQLSYGLAWTTKTVCPDSGGLRVVQDGDDWDLDWDSAAAEQCHKYRLEVRAGAADGEEVEEEVYLDGNSYTYAMPDSSARYFRVYAYPRDEDVAYRYPCSPIRAVGDP